MDTSTCFLPNPLRITNLVHMRFSSPHCNEGRGLPPNKQLQMVVEDNVDNHLLFVSNRPPSQHARSLQHVLISDNIPFVAGAHQRSHWLRWSSCHSSFIVVLVFLSLCMSCMFMLLYNLHFA